MIGRFIEVPEYVELKDYQEQAVDIWKENDFKGYFDMATGTGKTFTALAGLSEFSKVNEGRVATVIVCPYKHLVGQWEEDVIEWGGRPIICHSESNEKDWFLKLQTAFKRFRQLGYPFICITTNRSFVSEKMQTIVREITSDMKIALVIDEAHNFGATYLASMLPTNIAYRLGLSATFERYGDEEGTKVLTNYFEKKCISYSIEQAIADGKSLCPYEYHPIYTFLSENELQRYEYLTRKICECLVDDNGETKLSGAGQLLVYKRSRLLATADDKTNMLMKLMQDYRQDKHILVYCGAEIGSDEDGKIKSLIEMITERLNNELGIIAHKFTSQESIKERIQLKEMFADGMYQVLTAIRCLDEGVNIPFIKTAFIMASSRNPKEFVQRRGRLLRKAAGKEKAVIYDFVILPRRLDKISFNDYETDKAIVMGEMSRVYEFGRLSLNPVEMDRMFEEVQDAYNVRFDLDELTRYCKEEEYEFDRSQ